MKQPRDMTRREFHRALRDHGLKAVLLWVCDTTGQCDGVSWGFVFNAKTKNTMYRATLARALRGREEEIAKRAARAA
jgi:hypothetical protein